MNRIFFLKTFAFVFLIVSALYLIVKPGTSWTKPYLMNSFQHAEPSLFRSKPLVIWSNDFHISPINDLKHLLVPFGVRFIDKSLSSHCHITNTCEGRASLHVINTENAMNLEDPSLFQRFFEFYRDDAEMKTVDAFVCFHPASMCELFVPLNKSIIIIASTRYELGRFDAKRWTQWNENLVRIAADPKNFVGANNKYDLEYIRYFTGIDSLHLMPSYCGYLSDSYSPSRPGFILAPIHSDKFQTRFLVEFAAEANKKTNSSVNLFPLRSRYAQYKYSDLAAHQGIVHVPYQVSVMSLFEQYRMNIPMFFPSVELLASWQFEHMVMNERTWAGTYGGKPSRSSIEAHISMRHLPDPNNEQNRTAIRHWIQFADFYTLPHITYFDSVSDLIHILSTITTNRLMEISERMRQFSATAKKDLLDNWESVLTNVAKHSANRPH